MVLFANVTMVGIGMHQEIAQVIISSVNLASIIDPDDFSTFSETGFYSIYKNSISQLTFFLPQFFRVQTMLIAIIEAFATTEHVPATLDGMSKLIALVSIFKVVNVLKHLL